MENNVFVPSPDKSESQKRFEQSLAPMSQRLQSGVTGEVFYRHNFPVMPGEHVFLPGSGVLTEIRGIDFQKNGTRCVVVDRGGKQERYPESEVRRKICVDL